MPQQSYPFLGDMAQAGIGQAVGSQFPFLPLIVKSVMEFRKHNPKKSEQIGSGVTKFNAKVMRYSDPSSLFGGKEWTGAPDWLNNQIGVGTKSSDKEHIRWSDKYPAGLAESIGWGAWSDGGGGMGGLGSMAGGGGGGMGGMPMGGMGGMGGGSQQQSGMTKQDILQMYLQEWARQRQLLQMREAMQTGSPGVAQNVNNLYPQNYY